MPDLPKSRNEKAYQSEGMSLGSKWWGALDVNEETPELQWPRSVATYDKMRRQDAQVFQTLRALFLPILRTPWRIDPNGIEPGSPDWQIVEHVADDLGLPIRGQEGRAIGGPRARSRGRFDFHSHLRLALLALPMGHSFFNQVYDIRRDGPGGRQRAHLHKLLWIPPRTIESVNVAADGGLVSIRQEPRLGSAERPPEITVNELVAYVNDREGGNWLGQSILRPAYKFWLLKDRMLRVQAETVDRNGMGYPVHEIQQVPEGITGDDALSWMSQTIDEGLEIAQGMRSGDNAGASLKPGAKLSLLGVEGTLPDAEGPIRYYDEQIARALLANFLNLGGDKSTGSYALGDTFQDFFTLSLQSVAQEHQNVLNAHVVEDLVDVNYGVDAPSPRIVFDEIGSRHPVTAQAIYQLVQVGALRMDDALEAFLRTAWGLPAMDPATRRATLTKATTNAPPSATGDPSAPAAGASDTVPDGTEGNDAP